MMQLFPYQEAGAAFLAKRNVALLADDMGLGKSAQAIIACARSIPASVAKPMIVVICPASVRGVWAREFGRWWPSDVHPELHLVIESYDKVVRGTAMPDAIDALILDEGHYLKSKGSKRTKAIFGEDCDCAGGLANAADRVYVLTGTPTPNNSSELWPMLRALVPELILAKNGKPMSYWSFINKYCKTRDNGFGIQIVGNRNSEELKTRIAPFFLRRRKAEVLADLPPIMFDTLPVTGKLPVDDNSLMEINYLATELVGADNDDEVVSALKKMATHVASLRRLTGLAKVPGVVDWIEEWFEGGGGKLVVFGHHLSVLSEIEKALNDNSGKSLRKVDGVARSAEARQAEGDVLSVPMRQRESSHVQHVASEGEHRLYEVPPEKARNVTRSALLTVQRGEITGEAIERRFQSRLARDAGTSGVSSSRHTAAMESQKISSEQSISGSIGSGLGIHERQCVGDKLESQRHQAQREPGRDRTSSRKSSNKDVAVIVTGETSAAERERAIDRFQNDPSCCVFIGQIQAAGTGITLTASSDVLFAESSWVPADNQQAAMRVHRIGQKNACMVRFATLANSIDERIQAVVARKTSDIAQLFC